MLRARNHLRKSLKMKTGDSSVYVHLSVPHQHPTMVGFRIPGSSYAAPPPMQSTDVFLSALPPANLVPRQSCKRGGGTKRPAATNSAQSKKPPKRPVVQKPLATEAGVGPWTRSDAAQPQPNQSQSREQVVAAAELAAERVPLTYTQERLTKQKDKARATGASDCWTHVLGTPVAKISSEDDPATFSAARASVLNSAINRDSVSNLQRPSASFPRLVCLPCLRHSLKPTWRTWANTDGGSTRGIRNHLKREHEAIYLSTCKKIGYEISDNDDGDEELDVQEQITPEGMARYLAEFVADQDLAFNIVQASSLRRLLCYVGQGNIKPSTIPERQVVAETAAEASRQEKARIKNDMKRAKGRISITSDLWSDNMERAFMSVTAHYIDEYKNSVVDLLAFRVIEVSHTGANLGEHLFNVFKEYDILHKIGSITLDNTSNNDTMMQGLQQQMTAEGYSFDKEGNRIRCFPHVVNLAVRAFLDALSESGDVYRAERLAAGHMPSERTEGILAALKSRPDKLCQKIVVALRHGLRRRAVKQTIKEGNEHGWFKQHQQVEAEDGTLLDEWQEVTLTMELLDFILDCKAHWSSTRNMLKRFIYLYPASSRYISKNVEALPDCVMTHMQFKVLQDIAFVLDISHRAQELFSAEQTPTLSVAFPVYDQLIVEWRDAADQYPALAFAIRAGVQKLEDYVTKARSSPIHIMAMFLNPCIKYHWIDKHWELGERMNARAVVKRFMLKYLEAREQDTQENMNIQDMSSKASQSQGRGLNNILIYRGGPYEATGYDGSMDVTPPASPATNRIAPTPSRLLLPPEISHPVASPSKLALSHRQAVVDHEHDRYAARPVYDIKELGKIDLVKHWNSQEASSPLLYALALDVLPAQASSVSSERVFSSSKLTCTRARNKISANTVEYLQILKYSLRHRRAHIPTKLGELEKSEQQRLDEIDESNTLDLMNSLGDFNWNHDAVIEDEGLREE